MTTNDKTPSHLTNNNNKQVDSSMSSMSMSSSSLLMSETFTYRKTRIRVRVDFYSTHIEFTELTNKHGENIDDLSNKSKQKSTIKSRSSSSSVRLSIRDIAGSSIAKANNFDANDKQVCFTIYSYPRVDTTSHLPKRKKVFIELLLGKHDHYQENFDLANDFHKKLDLLIKNFDSEICNNNLDRSYSSSFGATNQYETNHMMKKPFLVFINPHSGAGKAQRIFFEHALPVWSQSNIPYTIILTKYANYASEYMQTVKLDEYRGILVVSGDGLVYEVINGIMNRSDWPMAIKMPIGQIPGGSANALACCTAYLSGEAFRNITIGKFAESMAFYYSKSKPTPMDLITVQLHNKKLIHSFLNIEWAIVADVDLESEKYRFLGNTRFLVGALKRILNLRIYRGRISFLPSDEMKDYKPKDPKIVIKRNTNQADDRRPSSITMVNQNDYSMFNIAGAATQLGASIGSVPGQNIDFKYLTPIDKPVPSDWLIIEDNFVFFLISRLPLISPDFFSAPEAQFNNGQMYLTFIRQGITKLQLLKLFKEMETGDYLDDPCVEYIKIKAFRLEPLSVLSKKEKKRPTTAAAEAAEAGASGAKQNDINNNISDNSGETSNSNNTNGIMMVDGEQVPYGVIQGEIKPGIANVLISQF